MPEHKSVLTLNAHPDDAEFMCAGTLTLLHEKGWISDPKGKARSVIVTEEGEVQAKLMFDKHFGTQR